MVILFLLYALLLQFCAQNRGDHPRKERAALGARCVVLRSKAAVRATREQPVRLPVGDAVNRPCRNSIRVGEGLCLVFGQGVARKAEEAVQQRCHLLTRDLIVGRKLRRGDACDKSVLLGKGHGIRIPCVRRHIGKAARALHSGRTRQA